MECVLATIHQFEQGRHHSHSASLWSFRCLRHLGVLSSRAVLSLHWSLPLDRLVRCATRNRYRATRTRCSIDRMRERGLSSFTSFFVVLPNTSIMENWFICGIDEDTRSYTSSIVNWSSNLSFNRMILPSISRNRNINRSNRVIIGIQMSSTDRQ